jgi:PBP1b-binding outer membrane lipoprotein LpoB
MRTILTSLLVFSILFFSGCQRQLTTGETTEQTEETAVNQTDSPVIPSVKDNTAEEIEKQVLREPFQYELLSI